MQDKLKKLIKQGEGERLDYKQSISNPNKIAKTICSFANTKGGKILVGIKDDKTICGIDPEEEKFMLDKAADFHCFPPVKISYKEIEEDGKIILIASIRESKEKPHHIIDKNMRQKVYIREKDKCLPVGKVMIDLLRTKVVKSKQKLNPEEEKLYLLIKNNHRTTLKEIMKLFNYSQRRTSRILINLLQKNMIRLHEHEKEKYYTC
jgi:predicted HTH transcriptional regulator